MDGKAKEKATHLVNAAGLALGQWVVVTICLLITLPPTITQATSISWNNPAGGTWSQDSNWLGDTPPGSADTAVLALVSGEPGYTIDFDGDEATFDKYLPVL